MCGLVGVASKLLTEPYKKAFYDMLYLDVLRGEDSTGVAAISNPFGEKPDLELFKSVEVGNRLVIRLCHWHNTVFKSTCY